MIKISVIDYGIGNVGSVLNMIKKVGFSASLASSPSDILNSDKLILPGVGSFDKGIQNLRNKNLVEALEEMVLGKKIPILGICLGMQLFCRSSEEGISTGLGWINANVVKFNFMEGEKLKLPHMGWNTVNIKKNGILGKTNTVSRFYFVHSYYPKCADNENVIASTEYGYEFTSAFQKENIIGVQFHPEKSHKYGMQLFKNFLSNELC